MSGPPDMKTFFATDRRARAFDLMRRGKNLPLSLAIPLLLEGVFVDPFVHWLRYMPGPGGLLMRQFWARANLRKFGKNSLVDWGALIDGPRSISIGDYVWIDHHVQLNASFGEITIGRRVHVAPYATIMGGGGVYIGDYAAVGASAQILSHSEAVDGGKRLSGPMILEEFKGMKTAPVYVEKDAMIGTGAIVLPGVTVGEGAVVAANSLVISNVKTWQIVMGVPARVVGLRPRVNVTDT